MSAKFKGVSYFKSLLRLKAPMARVQTTLKMFLRQCTLRLGRSAKSPGGGDKRASSQGTKCQRVVGRPDLQRLHRYCLQESQVYP
jgi:hypothetical protein